MYNQYVVLLAMVPPLVYVWLYVWIKSNPENGINLLRGLAAWKRERRERYIKKYGEKMIGKYDKLSKEIMLKEGFEEKYIDMAIKINKETNKQKIGEKYAEDIMGKPDEIENFF